MAQMYPRDIEYYDRATPGEKRIFRFIREAAKPDKDFICWYEPSVGASGNVPDFILFGKSLGLVVFEVKDWRSHQILAYDPHQFTVLRKGIPEKEINPYRQAKGYVDSLLEQLRKIPEFRAEQLGGYGKIRIPIARMIVFPNLTQHEYLDRSLQFLIPTENVLTTEDIAPIGELICDKSGSKFLKRVSVPLPFKFLGLTPKEIQKLNATLWPESKIEIPQRSGIDKLRFQNEVRWLDDSQERMALHIGRGHRVIKGPSGSGKTLVLIHRCKNLLKYALKEKKILLVCYNIALTSYLKRLIIEKGIGLGDGGIYVYHFYDLCAKILEEPLHFEKEGTEYYDMVTELALERAGSDSCHVGQFDAILIDEGQDFSDDMLRILICLLRPDGDLLVCLDSVQDLYMRKRSWKSVGIKAAGRTTFLKKVYRNTVEIFEFTQRFIGVLQKDRSQLSLPFDHPFHGEQPSLQCFESVEDLESFIITDLLGSLRNCEYKRSEIAIIYDDKIYDPEGFVYGDRGLPKRMLLKLERSGIPSIWVSQDVRSKEIFDITTDRVSLISIHSAKGLDFNLVYLVGMDHFHVTEETRTAILSLAYVAMTRAKYRLVIPIVEENEITLRMRSCLNPKSS